MGTALVGSRKTLVLSLSPSPRWLRKRPKELLLLELDRLGYRAKKKMSNMKVRFCRPPEAYHLRSNGRLSLPRNVGHLRKRRRSLEGLGRVSRNFWVFASPQCLTSLSDVAKNAAELIPYLDTEWKPVTLSVMLDLPVETVRHGIFELADKGIIYRPSEMVDDDYGVLPLTKEFLFNKWHEHQTFRKQVMARLDEMLETDAADGALLEWPEERRVKHLTDLARKRTRSGDFTRALKMVNLAQSWLAPRDLHREAVILRFLEGESLYMTGRKAPGIAHMRQAVTAENAQEYLHAKDFLFFAESLFGFGGLASEKEPAKMFRQVSN